MINRTQRNALPSLGGLWLMAENRVRELMARVHAAGKMASFESAGEASGPEYEIDGAGVATISIVGVLTKYESWLDEYCGFCPTEPLGEILARAVADTAVKKIELEIDTPGGMVSGTTQFAEAVAAANKIKPVIARVSDLCASGGTWIAAQCDRIYANATADIGSVGVYAVLMDDSNFWGDMGIAFTLVSSGGVKGMGADGVVSPELIADVQRDINSKYEQFIAAVASGRGMTNAEVRALADGRVWPAAEAVANGLIDEVATADEARAAIRAGSTANGNALRFTHLSNNELFARWQTGTPEEKSATAAERARRSQHLTAGDVAATWEECANPSPLPAPTASSSPAKISNSGAIMAREVFEFSQNFSAKEAKELAARDLERYPELSENFTSAAAALGYRTAERRGQVMHPRIPAGPPVKAPAPPKANASAPPIKPKNTQDRDALRAWAKETAEWEAEFTPGVLRGFSSKESYIAFRKVELDGRFRSYR